jgi:hypothetical protein
MITGVGHSFGQTISWSPEAHLLTRDVWQRVVYLGKISGEWWIVPGQEPKLSHKPKTY